MSNQGNSSLDDLGDFCEAVTRPLRHFCANIGFLFTCRLSYTRSLAERGAFCSRHPFAWENLHDIHWKRIDELCAYTHRAEAQLVNLREAVARLQSAGAESKKKADAVSSQLSQLARTLADLNRELAENRRLASARHDELERRLRRLDAITALEDKVRALDGHRDRIKTLEQRAASLETEQEGLPARMREIATSEAEATFNRLDDPAVVSERALANAERFSTLIGESIKP